MVASGVEVGARLDGLQIGFKNALRHAVRNGEVRNALDPRKTAIAFMTSFNGILVLIRSGCSHGLVHEAINGVRVLLD